MFNVGVETGQVLFVAADKARDDLDPSLAYDVAEFGHLGYDPAAGQPDPNQAVQNQYTGTWATWTPPNTDPRVGRLLARHVIDFVLAGQAKSQ